MIFSLGYARRSIQELEMVADQLDAIILDVRGLPTSRKKGFGGKQLATYFGPLRYQWKGDVLGNKGAHTTTIEGLKWLATTYGGDDEDGPNALLLCVCDAPGQCHRHFMVARQLLPKVTVFHVWDNELIESGDLQAFLDERRHNADASYEYRHLSPDYVDWAIGPRYSPRESDRLTRLTPRGGR